MFKKKAKICLSCGEVNYRGNLFCRCCGAELDSSLFKIDRKVKTKEDFGNKNILVFYIYNKDYDRLIEISKQYVIERKNDDELFDCVYLSNKHALIFVKGNRLFVRDLSSTNGTFINDKRLIINEDYQLNNGDSVNFANIRFEIRVEVEV